MACKTPRDCLSHDHAQLLQARFEYICLQVLKMVDNQHYLYRMTVLVAIASLAPAVHHDVLCSSMLPVVIGCSKDRVCSSALGLQPSFHKIQ